ncbi:MAG: lysine transporter, partial [Plesiomonas shigelloides]
MHDVNTTKEEPGTGLKRDLKARHLTMIAIGGAIGTGLFVASGATVAQAGPGGALVAYAVIGMMVFFVMTSLGEMAAFMPVSGSFSTYGTEFV